MTIRAVASACIALLLAIQVRAAPDAPAYEYQTWRTEAGLPQNSIHAIVQTHDGYLWLATEGGLARFDGFKFDVFDSENTPALRSNNVRSLLESKDQSLWIATADGLVRLQHGMFRLFTTEQGLPDNNVLSLFQDASGNLYAVTAEGTALYANGRFSKSPVNPPRKKIALKDRQGRLWIGTNDGLFVYQNGRADRLRYPDAVAHGAILSLLEDREGDIWVGTDADGVTVLRDQKFRKFGRAEGIPEDLIRCVLEDASGTLWAGTNGQGLRRFNGHVFTPFTTANGLSSDVILSLASSPSGELLVGTPDGLNLLDHGRVRWLTSSDGLPDDFIRSLYQDADGSLWIGTRRGLSHYVRGRFTNYTTADGLPSDLVGAILRDQHGVLWIGTLKGLACFNQGRLSRPASIASVHEAAITSLYEDTEGALWIGMDAGGLMRLQDQHVVQFPRTLGLPNTISGITEDSHGYLWITSPHGLCRVLKRELNDYAQGKRTGVSLLFYGTADGLPVNNFNTGGHPTLWRDHQNTIWFATARGLVSIDSRHTEPNRIPPPVVIEKVTADDRILDPSQAVAFGPSLSRISFEYAGLSFAAPQQVHYRYRLEGFDPNWIDAGTRRTAYYTNLPPGTYRFSVLARNGDGLWSAQPASLSFRLLPHFYQTNWFRALVLLSLAMLVYLAYRWRVSYVRSQFNAIMQERNRIAREIHDTLAQGYVGVSLQLELARQLLSVSLDSAREALQQAQELVQEKLAEARRSIWNLRSETGAEETLPAKLSQAVQQAVRNQPLTLKFEITGAYRPLPAKIENEILRIGQEAVANVVRHAKAAHLDVTLAFDPSLLSLTICDDGQGFAPAPQVESNGHFGIRGMRERAASINAKLSIDTAAGRGTRVCLELPLK